MISDIYIYLDISINKKTYNPIFHHGTSHLWGFPMSLSRWVPAQGSRCSCHRDLLGLWRISPTSSQGDTKQTDNLWAHNSNMFLFYFFLVFFKQKIFLNHRPEFVLWESIDVQWEMSSIFSE
jgi:hypothetical protein